MRLNQWKKCKKNLDDTELTRNEDYNGNKTLKTTKPEKKNCYRNKKKKKIVIDIIPRDLDFLFHPEKDHFEPKRTVSAINKNYI